MRSHDERGFMLVELLVAMFILVVALTAVVSVFVTSTIITGLSARKTTAAFLADAQMEVYRAMTSRDIGLDLSSGTVGALPASYVADPACANTTTGKTCTANGVAATETGPTGSTPDTCTTIDGWYANTLPCAPSRTVGPSTTPASPDGRTYRIDTYIVRLAATGGSAAARAQKQVTVVVRSGATLSTTLIRETTIVDCSTGETPGSPDC